MMAVTETAAVPEMTRSPGGKVARAVVEEIGAEIGTGSEVVALLNDARETLEESEVEVGIRTGRDDVIEAEVEIAIVIVIAIVIGRGREVEVVGAEEIPGENKRHHFRTCTIHWNIMAWLDGLDFEGYVMIPILFAWRHTKKGPNTGAFLLGVVRFVKLLNINQCIIKPKPASQWHL